MRGLVLRPLVGTEQRRGLGAREDLGECPAPSTSGKRHARDTMTTQDIDARSARKNSGEGRKGCFVRVKGAWLEPIRKRGRRMANRPPERSGASYSLGVGGAGGAGGGWGPNSPRRSKEGNEVSSPFTLRARRNGRATI